MRRPLLLLCVLCLLPLQASAQSAQPNLTGQMLVADPGMTDPRFEQAVVFVIRQDDGGTLGIVVNRPMGTLPLEQLVDGVRGDITIHYGGPVQPSLALVLHPASIATDRSILVDEKRAVSAETDILRRADNGSAILTLGYAGWAPGQLRAELDAGFWAVVPAADDILFGPDNSAKWERARASIPFEL